MSEPVAAGVLLVDDDEGVLSALKHVLTRSLHVVGAVTSGAAALEVLEQDPTGVALMISDYSMPDMNGVELLRLVRQRWPEIGRVLLTGKADLATAARAVNEVQLLRLLTKPWQPVELQQSLASALEQHRLGLENARLHELTRAQATHLEAWNEQLEQQVTERTEQLGERTEQLAFANQVLERGLLETVRLLLNLLEQRLPERAVHCRQVARLAGRLAKRAGLSTDVVQRLQIAGLVFDIGLVSLPDAELRRHPSRLGPVELARYRQHPIIAEQMLGAIETLAEMGRWIRHHHERWDGLGYPDSLAGPAIPLESRIIAVADGYIQRVESSRALARDWLRQQRRKGSFDPDMLLLLEEEVGSSSAFAA